MPKKELLLVHRDKILIRGLSNETIQNLSERAKINERSLEAEARFAILSYLRRNEYDSTIATPLKVMQSWSEPNAEDNLIQESQIGGQSMLLFANIDKTFELRYLGYEVKEFSSIQEAKEIAPYFAKQVLIRILSQINTSL